ncbi:hypothetical protein FQZ97_779680 [compost metagenome]
MFHDKRLRFGLAQKALDLPRMPLANLWIAEHQRVAQQLFHRDSLVRQDRMSRRHRHHQWLTPGRSGDNAIADLVRLSKPCVVQLFEQPLDLLGQRHFKKANLDFRLLLPTERQERGKA